MKVELTISSNTKVHSVCLIGRLRFSRTRTPGVASVGRVAYNDVRNEGTLRVLRHRKQSALRRSQIMIDEVVIRPEIPLARNPSFSPLSRARNGETLRSLTMVVAGRPSSNRFEAHGVCSDGLLRKGGELT